MYPHPNTRFTQAGSEVSALLGRIPSAVGYQPTLATDMGTMQVNSGRQLPKKNSSLTDSLSRNLDLKFPFTGMCYHAVVSKPLPLIPISGNVLLRSRD